MHPQVLTYDIDEVVPYINWLYFYHAWGMSGKPLAEKQRLESGRESVSREHGDER